MSVQFIQSQISSAQRNIESLNRKLSDKARDEANKSARISQIQSSITKHTSINSIQSKSKEIERTQQDIVRIQRDKADFTKQLSQATEKLHRLQSDLFKEQTREQKDFQSKLEQRLKREAESRIQEASRNLRFEVSGKPATAASTNSNVHEFDAFICHATEDKLNVAAPLAKALTEKGYMVWYDEFQMKVGDSLRQSIDRGLARSRFGIVVFSPSFFAKNWTQYELNGLVNKEMNGGKVILPLWHKVSKNEVMAQSPSLADKVALKTSDFTIEELATKLSEVLGDPVNKSPD
ncbi:MAG TPA: TIR domain-containing protein [Phycisphaerales bacterium]|nr:TIR domain-containing protein [Phycisphaerales bacterium]